MDDSDTHCQGKGDGVNDEAYTSNEVDKEATHKMNKETTGRT